MGLHQACIDCIAGRKARYGDNWNKVDCKGIETDPLVNVDTSVLTEEQKETARLIFDPWYWALKEFKINQRDYQEIMVKCTATKKIFRLGRRAGKTNSLLIPALHTAFTSPNKKILLFTPFEDQIELFFRRIEEWMLVSKSLKTSIKRFIKDPFIAEFGNGSFIRGFTTGAKSGHGAAQARGQEADIVILDEADLLMQADLISILPMLQKTNEASTEEKLLWVSSTPTGRREFFFKWCNDPSFKEFHYPSWINPAWGPKDEAFFRSIIPTQTGWDQEIGAEFGIEQEGVYQHPYIDRAVTLTENLIDKSGSWDYTRQSPQPGCLYMIGVDWNTAKHGVQIVVVEFNPSLRSASDTLTGRVRIVTRESIETKEFTQTIAVDRIIKLNDIWHPHAIYVDEGYGATQIEDLRRYGMIHPESKIIQRLKPKNFSEMHEVRDPKTKAPVKKHMKPFMVENSVRFFEKNAVLLNKSDKLFIEQLTNYRVARTSTDGRPVYSEGNDHTLDAFNLALLAFTMELTDLGKPIYASRAYVVAPMGEKRYETMQDGDEVKLKDRTRTNSPILKPRQIPLTDMEGNKISRLWANQKYNSHKQNRPLKREL